MYSKENKRYWEQWNSKYSTVWESVGRRAMSRRELKFIEKNLVERAPGRILDVGVGNGRILESLIRSSSDQAEIFGIDVSDKMVNICREKFKDVVKVQQIVVCDLSTEVISFGKTFDFVTMIRVLKYNKNWQEMIHKISAVMNPGGVYIFTMPNRVSISGFSGDTFSDQKLPILYSSRAELEEVVMQAGFTRVEFCAFSKMPNFLYHISESRLYVALLLFVEKTLEVIFGKAFLGRELFVLCVK